mgnify:CR=1 FL=1
MSKYEGTKTEQNLMTAFAGESQARISIHSMLLRQERPDMYRLRISLKRQQIRRKSTLKCGSKNSTESAM